MNHENKVICEACGGKCCKSYAGSYIPEDFGNQITVDLIVNLLKGGKVAMDWWEGDATGKGSLDITFYLRPRHKEEGAIKGSWGGECINLTPKGCELTISQRPFQCRVLIPKVQTDKCYFPNDIKASKQDCAKSWYQWQNIMKMAKEKYYEEKC